MPRARGGVAEEIAALYLELIGYELLARNARFGRLEIDLIAQRGETIAFVEVRMRSSRSHGRPEETVRRQKARALQRAAEGLWPRLNPGPQMRARIDLIAIERLGWEMQLRHHPGWVRTQRSYSDPHGA